MPVPTVEAATEYLGDDTTWTEEQVSSAFASEKRAQARICRIPAIRTASVSTTDTSPVLTAEEADTFTSEDVDAAVSGAGIPEGATILTVDSDTQVTLSEAATATGADVTLTIDPDRSDLNEALYRRVAHNLAVRALPLGLQATITDGAALATQVGGTDAEVRRLEKPYRQLVFG